MEGGGKGVWGGRGGGITIDEVEEMFSFFFSVNFFFFALLFYSC